MQRCGHLLAGGRCLGAALHVSKQAGILGTQLPRLLLQLAVADLWYGLVMDVCYIFNTTSTHTPVLELIVTQLRCIGTLQLHMQCWNTLNKQCA